jgi:cysteinyl-tRNA synthetase
MIDDLVANGCAYVAEDHVLFDVAAMPDYGKLSGRSLDEMIAGARVEVAPYKRDPMDFVLWKPSKPGEPAWPSPAGIAAPGRPGWHIECSAMSWKHLGETFDIHGGGIDLVFPHHENEIAQSRCAFHTPVMANYWLHNGFLQVEGEKMAKSLGNFVTIHELLQESPGDVVRLQMLMTHYRQPLDWTETQSMLARDLLSDWAHVLEGYYEFKNDEGPANEVLEALSEDMNTPEAITALHGLAERARRGDLQEKLLFASSCKLLGFRQLNKPGLFETGVSGSGIQPHLLFTHYDSVARLRAAIANDAPQALTSDIISTIERDGVRVNLGHNDQVTLQGTDREVEQRIAARTAARKVKDFKEADRIRDELAAIGIELKDAKDPKTGELVTTWRFAR